MHSRKLLLAATLAAASAAAFADTLTLTNGSTVDGKVKVNSDGIYEVDAGGNLVFYRPDEVTKHEQNERDGTLNMDEIKAQVEAVQAKLTEQTGLTLEQRNRVDDLLNRIRSGSPSGKLDAKDQLVKMNQEVSLLKYLDHWLDSAPSPELLEAVFLVQQGASAPKMEKMLTHDNPLCRATAIELLAKMGKKDDIPQLARGLADHKLEVRLAAIYAMAALGVKEASPALAQMTADMEMKVSNASKQALGILWKTELAGKETPGDSAAWEAFVKQQAPGGAFKLSDLKPLVEPGTEFIYG